MPDSSLPFELEFAEKVEASLLQLPADVRRTLRARFHHLGERGIRTPSDAVGLLTDEHAEEEWSSASLMLAAYDDIALAPAIAEALRDARSPILKQWCLGCLGPSGGEVSRRAIIGVLRTNDDRGTRFAAVTSLGSYFGDKEVVLPLAECLSSPAESADVRAQAARALGTVGVPSAEGPLIDGLDDVSPDVREAAAWSLGAVGTEAALVKLQRLVEHDGGVASDGPVREAAASAISNIRMKAGFE